MAFYRSCLQRRLYTSGPEKTMLAKATQSAGAVESLLEAFPDAKFITIVRDPSRSVASHVSLFWPAWQAHSPHLKKDGPEAKAYARLAVRWFQHLFAFRNKVDPRQYYCIDYRDLKRDPEATLRDLYRHFGWTMSSSFQEKLAHASRDAQEFASSHSYSLEEFGLSKEWIREELGELLDFYNLHDEMDRGAVRPSSDRGGVSVPVKSPPGDMQQPEGDKKKAVGYDGGGYGGPVETFNRHKQGEGDITVARSHGHNPSAAPVGAAHEPAEENRDLTEQRHRDPRLPAKVHD